jgi:hypothetical protein
MKLSRALLSGLLPCLAVGFLSVSSARSDTPAKTATPAAGTNTNSAAAEFVIPQSSFDLTSKDIKDPFFPQTLRQPIPALATNNVPLINASSFALKALSGAVNQRLALINNRTMAPGESAEVTTAGGTKLKIRCVEIKESSVVIRLENSPEPIELHLKGS